MRADKRPVMQHLFDLNKEEHQQNTAATSMNAIMISTVVSISAVTPTKQWEIRKEKE
jgi:hypothetical protein